MLTVLTSGIVGWAYLLAATWSIVSPATLLDPANATSGENVVRIVVVLTCLLFYLCIYSAGFLVVVKCFVCGQRRKKNPFFVAKNSLRKSCTMPASPGLATRAPPSRCWRSCCQPSSLLALRA